MIRRQWIPEIFAPFKSVLLSASLIPVSAPVWAQSPEAGPGYWHNGWDGWGWGHMMFGGLMMIVFWAGVILLVVFAVRWFGRAPGPHAPPPEKSAIEILNERFARGEIEKEEYEERKKILSG